jgi:hypothetical protein
MVNLARNLSFILILIIHLQMYAFGQEANYLNKQFIGITIGNGFPYYRLPEGGYYRLVLLQGDYRFPMLKTEKKTNVLINIVPQFNLVFVNQKTYYEFGCNLNLEEVLQISNKSMVGLFLGSGPHFISYESKRQAKGFIFSDNLCLTYHYMVSPKTEIGLSGGMRHVSNAGLKRPNGGINDWIGGISMGRIF